ncbi:MAG: 5'-nucleotidase C-terminal domain-containing protein [Evtepia sp.]
MKKWNKFAALFLAVVMAFSLAIPAGAVESEDEDMTGYTVILHTNDVHGGISGYAAVAALKQSYEDLGAYVLLVDAGDFIQGDPTVSVSQGATAVELMNLAGYNVAAPGNHEFDYGYANLVELADQADFPILAANIQYNGELAFGDNIVFTAPDGTKIGFFGLDTPETATKAHPAKIQGVTFLAGQEMFDCAQAQVDALEADGCDIIICLGHLGIDAESVGNRSIDLLEKVDGIDVFIDGHSHSTLEDIVAATNETATVNDTLLTSTGTKLNNIGVIEIAPDGTIDVSNVITSALVENGVVTPDAVVAAKAEAIQAEIDADYGAVFAQTEVDLQGEKANVRTGETNLADLITDAMLWQANSLGEPVDAAVTNGGGIRASIPAGDITKKDINTVLPFGNTLYIVKVTGAELQEALEASTYCTPEAIGGFPQVAGINFTLNTGAPYDTSSLYPDSTYGKPDSINRVMIQTVGGEAFDPNETYTIVTNDFLGAGGDTYYAFKASPIGYDLGVPLDEVVMDYITSQLGGVVTEADYGSTQSRINTISYTDVTAGDWYANAVTYVTLTGLMNGSNGAFQPSTNLTRAMMVTVLYRMAGQPEVTQENPFQDVAADTWYTNAVIWASETGITTGTSDTTFAPTKALTREQLASFFYRFAQYESGGEIPAAGDNLASFSDAGKISSYAIDAVNWAVGEGLISGVGNSTLAPQNSATRAQVATILMRYTAE